MPASVILPAGFGPLGFAEGIDFVSTSKPPAILADDVDAETGEVNSLIRGIDPTDSAVIQIARTERGSGAAVLDIGHRLKSIRKNDPTAPGLAESYVREMFADLIRDGRIEIESVESQPVGPMNDGLALLVAYRNLRTGERQTVTI